MFGRGKGGQGVWEWMANTPRSGGVRNSAFWIKRQRKHAVSVRKIILSEKNLVFLWKNIPGGYIPPPHIIGSLTFCFVFLSSFFERKNKKRHRGFKHLRVFFENMAFFHENSTFLIGTKGVRTTIFSATQNACFRWFFSLNNFLTRPDRGVFTIHPVTPPLPTPPQHKQFHSLGVCAGQYFTKYFHFVIF